MFVTYLIGLGLRSMRTGVPRLWCGVGVDYMKIKIHHLVSTRKVRGTGWSIVYLVSGEGRCMTW